MDIRNRAVVFLALAMLLGPQLLSAQASRGVVSSAKAAASATKIERAVTQTLAKRPDIRLSIARLDYARYSSLPVCQRPQATAFLFKTTYKGKPQVWAATAGYVAQPGEKLLLTFYNGKTPIIVNGVLAQQGPALLSEVALIKLPDPLPKELHPLELSSNFVAGPLSAWDYSGGKLRRSLNLSLEKNNGFFVRTRTPKTPLRALFYGGPLLNNKGQALGVHCSSSTQCKVFAADASIIPYLLEAYHEGTSQIPLLINGLFLGAIAIDERIYSISVADSEHTTLAIKDIYDQLHQSEVLQLMEMPRARFIKFVLGSYDEKNIPVFRVLVYDIKKQINFVEPFGTVHH